MKALFAHFREMKHYFIASALVFFAGILLGYVSNAFHPFIYDQIKGIQVISQKISESRHPHLFSFGIIFLNNTIKSILFVYLGIVFGIVPLFILIVNGMILGFLMVKTVEAHGNLLALIVKGILPHGIIELTSVIIACAYGIKFGFLALKWLGSALRPAYRSAVRSEMARFVRLTVPLVLLISVSLCIAALIESTVTVWLLKQ